MHILISNHLPPSGWDALRADPGITTSGPFATRAEILAAIPSADAIIVRSATIVDTELLDAAPQLKAIARAGARLDNIDLDETTRRGLMVINVPNANIFAVAEHTLGMLIALARGIPQGYNAVRIGEWPRHKMLGFQLHGKTLGVLGFGRLGRAVATRAQAFGLHTLAYDPYIDLSLARELGVEVVDFPELLTRADIVTTHTRLTAHTRRMMDADAFARMKPGAYFVNCTHAGLVDEAALLETLEAGHLAGAALDTFQQEPPPPKHPLLCHPRVLAVPHLNQNTIESQAETGQRIVADLLDALHARDYRNIVNLPFDARIPYSAVYPYIHLADKLGKLQGQLAGGWITRVEVELLGKGLENLVRPMTATLLTGMLRSTDGRPVNWISAPIHAHKQGIETTQAKNLLPLADYPNLLICRITWEDGGSRTVAGVLFANGDARLVQYDNFRVDAHPEGYVLIIENDDIPGVIGKVGTVLGRAQINIANWRYGRETPGGKAVSFINVDDPVPVSILRRLENEPEIHRAQLVHL